MLILLFIFLVSLEVAAAKLKYETMKLKNYPDLEVLHAT